MTKSNLLAIASIAIALGVGGAHAGVLLTSDVGYSGPTLDLTAYETGNYNFTFGPESIPGGITFTVVSDNTNSGNGGVLGQGSYGLGGNGSFGDDAVYAAIDASTGYMQFALDAPVSEFGLYLNYATGYADSPMIETIDSSGNVISSFDLASDAPISTPSGFNEFEFRGIQEDSGIIYGLRLSNSFLLAAATASGAPDGGNGDDGGANDVPAPAPLALLGFGLMGFAITRRRRRR